MIKSPDGEISEGPAFKKCRLSCENSTSNLSGTGHRSTAARVEQLKLDMKYLLERNRLLQCDVYEYEAHEYCGIDFRYEVSEIAGCFLGTQEVGSKCFIDLIRFPEREIVGECNIQEYFLRIQSARLHLSGHSSLSTSCDVNQVLVGPNEAFLRCELQVSANDRSSFSRCYSVVLKVSKQGSPVNPNCPMTSTDLTREGMPLLWLHASQDTGQSHPSYYQDYHRPPSPASSPLTSDCCAPSPSCPGPYIVESSLDVLSLYLSLLNMEEQRALCITTTIRNHPVSTSSSFAPSPSPVKITSPLAARPSASPPNSAEANIELYSPYSQKSVSRSSCGSGGGVDDGNIDCASSSVHQPYLLQRHQYYHPSGGLHCSALSDQSVPKGDSSLTVGMYRSRAVAPNREGTPFARQLPSSPCDRREGVQFSYGEEDDRFEDNPLLSMWQSEVEDEESSFFRRDSCEGFGCPDAHGETFHDDADCLRSTTETYGSGMCRSTVTCSYDSSTDIAKHAIAASTGGIYEC